MPGVEYTPGVTGEAFFFTPGVAGWRPAPGVAGCWPINPGVPGLGLLPLPFPPPLENEEEEEEDTSCAGAAGVTGVATGPLTPPVAPPVANSTEPTTSSELPPPAALFQKQLSRWIAGGGSKCPPPASALPIPPPPGTTLLPGGVAVTLAGLPVRTGAGGLFMATGEQVTLRRTTPDSGGGDRISPPVPRM